MLTCRAPPFCSYRPSRDNSTSRSFSTDRRLTRSVIEIRNGDYHDRQAQIT